MSFNEAFQKELLEIERQGRRRELYVSNGISFVNNDYLGLRTHPKLIEAGQIALKKWGAGSGGSRLFGGNSRLAEETEEAVASFFGSPAALLFSSGYLANLAVVQTVAPFCDHIVSDEKNHASLIDAIGMSRKPKQIIAHQQWDEIPEELEKKKLLLVSESLFSMDGDFVCLDRLKDLWQKNHGFLLLDEAHAAGLFPEDGRGLHQVFNDWERLAVTVTFGKAFGCSGAAILCSKVLRDLMLSYARTFIFTTALSPGVLGSIGAALEVVRDESWRRTELYSRSQLVRSILKTGGDSQSKSPIIPFLIPGAVRALNFCKNMRQLGFELRAVRHPTVPKGGERIRISLSLSVSREDTQRMANELVRQWTEFSSRESILE